MNTSEQLQRQIVERFDQSIYAIRDAGVHGISEIAEKLIPKFTSQSLKLAPDNPLLHSNTPTEFDLYQLPVFEGRFFQPLVV